MGYAPADDPQVVIYVVVDRPNVLYQDDAKYATRIVRNILTEVLPYMNIFMTENSSERAPRLQRERKGRRKNRQDRMKRGKISRWILRQGIW